MLTALALAAFPVSIASIPEPPPDPVALFTADLQFGGHEVVEGLVACVPSDLDGNWLCYATTADGEVLTGEASLGGFVSTPVWQLDHFTTATSPAPSAPGPIDCTEQLELECLSQEGCDQLSVLCLGEDPFDGDDVSDALDTCLALFDLGAFLFNDCVADELDRELLNRSS